ncbi:aspartate aminotransferase family protein [Thiohalomonas denitrificans]|uniref:aspartate aminotransferase family protein n=1 Tax=Thiohalomonas denitrificans TaxID=415747 RepID=UPI0026EB3B75|nr:aspartate aminotransferase family protein [Thiohalomonas denitrificans]
MADVTMSTYARLPVAFERGEGPYLWDGEGNRYLDAVSGIAVCGLGHAHPAVTRAICEQAGRLVHTSNLYRIDRQEQLAHRLCAYAGMDRVFFANSGAEANEAAIKLARLYGHKRGIDSPTVIVAEGSFHGRTLATLSATGNRKVQAGFEPLVKGFARVPYNDIEAVRHAAKLNPEVVAVLVEPIQGESGINQPDPDYLAQLRTVCDENGWLLMLDEIQTGMGRTGKPFAWQHGNAAPDVVTVAKALGNGVPIGACMARGHAADLFQPGNHGSTFGGNPLACAAALAVVEILEFEGLAERAGKLGQRMRKGFEARLGILDSVTGIRGEGLMIGIELDGPCGELVKQALAKGLLINVAAERVVRLLPPLIINESQADRIVEEVSGLIEAFVSEPKATETK